MADMKTRVVAIQVPVTKVEEATWDLVVVATMMNRTAIIHRKAGVVVLPDVPVAPAEAAGIPAVAVVHPTVPTVVLQTPVHLTEAVLRASGVPAVLPAELKNPVKAQVRRLKHLLREAGAPVNFNI